MKIIIAGGSGLIGTSVTKRLLAENHHVVMLTRRSGNREQSHPRLMYQQWDGGTIAGWAKHVDGADAVVNLAGELIAGKRWSPAQKRMILESRVNATRTIAGAIRQATRKPSVLINASAVGYYGNVEEGEVNESQPKGSGFLADVCEQWERAAGTVSALNVRVAIVRLGVVLDAQGGALPKIMTPFRFGVGGWLGSGKQWFPWIHCEDIANAIVFTMEHKSIEGAINLTAPGSVRMKEFCKTLGQVMHRPSFAPAPALALKIALGEMSEMLLTGQNAVPKKLLDNGYDFLYPDLRSALQSLLEVHHE